MPPHLAAGGDGGDCAKVGETPGPPWLLLPLPGSRTTWRSGALSLPDGLGSSPSYPTLTTCVVGGTSLLLFPPPDPPPGTGSHTPDTGSPDPCGYYCCHGHVLSSDADGPQPTHRPLLWTVSPQAHQLCLGPRVPRLLWVPMATVPPSPIPGVLVSVHASHVRPWYFSTLDVSRLSLGWRSHLPTPAEPVATRHPDGWPHPPPGTLQQHPPLRPPEVPAGAA